MLEMGKRGVSVLPLGAAIALRRQPQWAAVRGRPRRRRPFGSGSGHGRAGASRNVQRTTGGGARHQHVAGLPLRERPGFQ